MNSLFIISKCMNSPLLLMIHYILQYKFGLFPNTSNFFVHLRSYGAAISAIASADAPWSWALQLLDDMCSNSVEDGSGMK